MKLCIVSHKVHCLDLYYFILTDMFLECKNNNFNSNADDTIPCSSAEDMSFVIIELKKIAKKIFRWFENNYLEANPGKSHVLLSSNTEQVVPLDNIQITSSLSEKLLGITFDSELKLEEHISKICNIVNKKLNVSHRIAYHMSLDKRKMLLKAFIESQFRYYPLI